MNKKLITAAIMAATFSFFTANAQIAGKKGVTYEQLMEEIGTLAQKGDDDAKAQLMKEAAIMAKSKNELFVMMAPSVYQFVGNEDEAEKVTATLKKRFPKGLQARKEAFEAFIDDETLTIAQLEKKYADWLKKFPKSNFEKLNQGMADSQFGVISYYKRAAQLMAERMIERGDFDKGLAYAQSEDNVDMTPILDKLIAAGKFEQALPIAAQTHEKMRADVEKAKAGEGSLPRANWYYNSAAAQHAFILNELGKSDQAIAIAQELVDGGYTAPSNIIVLAEGLQKQGKDLDAFMVLHQAMVKSGRGSSQESLYEAAKAMYTKLNNNKGDVEKYTASLDKEIKDALVAKYRAQMIKKEAPAFSMLNRKGETISLADLKGKVVVLDFWATWCGPCVQSFPGMQAAVNKYANDEEVEFLFINTWQREENYKELVDQFITDKNYSFHVIFDEMNDREKAATTAYGVRGIPHKVIIDKEGFIRFESSGSSADVDAIVSELETKIELARKG